MTEEQKRKDDGTQKLAAKIALKGGRGLGATFISEEKPHCDSPVRIERRILYSREGKHLGKLKLSDITKALEVSMWAPCRRCAKCLQFRQCQWRERAIWECDRTRSSGHRTWFITLTFSPIHLAGIRLSAKGTGDREIEAAAYPHVQRFFKRLRKLGNQFRYMAVYELGERTGRSHYHMLLHEQGPRPTLKAQLESQWRSNVHARLVDGGEAHRKASYVTKYTVKSFSIRPRASARYGKLIVSSLEENRTSVY